MTDPILSKIASQTLACTLYALRTVMIEAERWDEARHGAAYARRMTEITERWKR